jgi:hypothetical protein
LEGAPVSAASATDKGKCPSGAARAARSAFAVGRGSAFLFRAGLPLPAHGWTVLVVEVVMVGFSVLVIHSVSVKEIVVVDETSLVSTAVEVVLIVFHKVFHAVYAAGVVVTRLAK